MDYVKLMQRTDTKFFFSISKLEDILFSAKENYNVLEIDNNCILNYNTLYFDTKKFSLYTQHQNGKLNRYKIRHRQYIESDISYFEIKFKSNKEITIKKRIERPSIEKTLSKESKEFIENYSSLNPNSLEPKLYSKFSRITLVHKTKVERITFDFNLSYKSNNNNINLPSIVIAEVKKDKHSTPSDMIKILHKNKIYKQRFSKYCIGTSLLNQDLKSNRFKHKLLTINKINYDQFNAFTK